MFWVVCIIKHGYIGFALLGVSNSSYGLETYGTAILECGGIADSDFPI